MTFGVNYADRTKAKEQFQSNLMLPENVSHMVVPEQYRTGIANTAFFGSPHGMIGYNALAMWRDNFWSVTNSVDDPTANDNDRVNNVQNTWQVDEKLTTAFVKLGVDTELGGLPLRGNIGVQAIQADQTSHLHITSAVIPDNTPVLPIQVVEEGAKYTDILPSLNLALEFPHDMKLRFAAATTVARPRLDDLGGGASYNTVSDTGAATIVDGVSYYWSRNGGGNPELEPWKSNNFDLSFEKYFGDNKGYFAAAIYYKDIDTYIFNAVRDRRFHGCAAAGTCRPHGYVHLHRCGRKPHGYLDAQDERQGWLRARLRAHVVAAVLVVRGSAGWLRVHPERREERVFVEDQR